MFLKYTQKKEEIEKGCITGNWKLGVTIARANERYLIVIFSLVRLNLQLSQCNLVLLTPLPSMSCWFIKGELTLELDCTFIAASGDGYVRKRQSSIPSNYRLKRLLC